VIPTQWWMSGVGHGWLPARWGWSGPSPGKLYEPQSFPTSSLSQIFLSHRFIGKFTKSINNLQMETMPMSTNW
jgi:hypothetical protein